MISKPVSSMSSRRISLAHAAIMLCASALLGVAACSKKSSAQISAPTDLQLDVKVPFRFIAYGRHTLS